MVNVNIKIDFNSNYEHNGHHLHIFAIFLLNIQMKDHFEINIDLINFFIFYLINEDLYLIKVIFINSFFINLISY
jgi:hypothetical protein